MALLLTAALGTAHAQKKCTSIDLPRDDFTGKFSMLTWDCARFEGDFVKGRLQKGTITYGDGESKEGSFTTYGELQGPGKRRQKDGTLQEGNFTRDSLHGQAKLTFPDGRVYSGPVRYARANGIGRVTYPDGAFEEGSFSGDEVVPFGFVLRTNADGSRLAGEYRAGKPFGKFVLARRDGTGEVTYYDWGGARLAGPPDAAGTAPAASSATAAPASVTQAAPAERAPPAAAAPSPAPAQQPAAPSAADSIAAGASKAAGQVADEVGRAVRGLRSIFGQ